VRAGRCARRAEARARPTRGFLGYRWFVGCVRLCETCDEPAGHPQKEDKWPILFRCISPHSGQFSHTNYSLEIARHSSESARYPMPAHDPKDLPVPPPEVQKSPANRRAGPAHSAPRAARWLSRSTAPIAFDRRGSGGTRGARGRRSGRLDTRAAARLTEAGTRGRSGNGGDRRTRPRTPRAMAARTARPALGVGALEESAAAGAARYEVRLRDTRPRAAMRVARTRPRRFPARAGGGKRRASGARARCGTRPRRLSPDR